jgi:hypothetical protein
MAQGSSNPTTDLKKIAGTNVSVNAGNADAGTQRVVVATNQSAIPVSLASVPSHPVTNAGTFAVQAAQSGTWNIGTVTSITNSVAVTGPLTDAQLRATAVPVSGTLGIAANSSINLNQVAGTATATGNGVVGAGVQRVAIASDNTAFAVNATLSAETTKVIGTVNQGGTWNIGSITTLPTLANVTTVATLTNQVQMGGQAIAMGTGVRTAGTQRVTIATDDSVPVTGTFWQATQPVSGTVTANQGGTWNITNISGTVSLPTGAATAANQTTQTTALQLLDDAVGTSGTAIATGMYRVGGTDGTNNRLLSVNTSGHVNIADGGNSITVDGTFWQATQPVSLASVPSHPVTNAGTFAVQAAQSGTWNIGQLGGANVSMNTGVRDAGTQRVTIATNDSVPVTGTFWPATQPVSGTVSVNALPAGTNSIGNIGTVATLTNQVQMGGQAIAMGTGVRTAGTQRVTIATDDVVPVSQSGVWSNRITDGTNTATVKAASTAPVVTDTALVVSLGPNSKAYDPVDDMLKVKSVQKKFRDSFPGASLNATNWDSSIGAGGSITITGGNLVMASGTTASSTTSITSKEIFTIPFRLSYQLTLSQRIANQTFIVEAISVNPTTGIPDDLHTIAWLYDGTTVTQAKYRVQNSGITPLDSAASTVVTTAGTGVYEIEPFSDEAWFHSMTLDSTAGRSNSYRRHQQIPDPNALYKIRLRWVNGGTAPASSTNATMQFVTCQDYAELTAEITAGRGNVVAGQALGVQVLNTQTVNLSGTGTLADNAAFTDGSTRVVMSGYIFDEVAGTALTENDAAAARIDAKRSQINTIEDGVTRGRYATVTADNAIKVDGSAVTQPISGTVTANTGLTQPLTDTQLRATAVPVSLASVPSHPVTNAGTFAVQVSSALPAGTNNIGDVDVLTLPAVTIAASQTLATVTTVSTVTSLSQLAGQAINLGAGTSASGTQRIIEASAATGTQTNPSLSTTSATVLAANVLRRGATIFNNSTSILFIRLSATAASSTTFTAKLNPEDYYEVPGNYNGAITGILNTGTTTAVQVTEIT